jgi:hypothetical protein
VQYFERSVLVDLTDNQGNTGKGMHIASAAGTWQILVNGFGGLRIEVGINGVCRCIDQNPQHRSGRRRPSRSARR